MQRSRADFLSLGITVDLPLFTAGRQDQELEASKLSAESIKTEKRLLLRNMMAQLDGLYRNYHRQEQRIALYQNAISQQLHEQAEAALTAYTNDDGDFAEVMRARIAELNGRIEQIVIVVERVKLLQHIDYFFTHDKPQQTTNTRVKP
jgi:outer membrane protein TolC